MPATHRKGDGFSRSSASNSKSSAFEVDRRRPRCGQGKGEVRAIVKEGSGRGDVARARSGRPGGLAAGEGKAVERAHHAASAASRGSVRPEGSRSASAPVSRMATAAATIATSSGTAAAT